MVGAILVCRTKAGSAFTAGDAAMCGHMASYLGPALANALRHRRARADTEKSAAELHALRTEYVRTKTDLENRLHRSEELGTAYMQKMYEAERGEQQVQEDATRIRRELSRLKQDSQDEITHLREDLIRSIQQVARLTQQVAELDARCLKLTQDAEALERDKATLKLRLASASAAAAALPALAASDSLLPTSEAAQHASQEEPESEETVPGHATATLSPLLTESLNESVTLLVQNAEELASRSTGKLDRRQRGLLRRMHANVEQIRSTLGSLATLRALDSEQAGHENGPVDVSHMIEDALEHNRYRLEEKQLRTRLEVATLPPVRTNAAYTQQIVDNLVSHACQSSKANTTIDVHAFLDQASAEPASNGQKERTRVLHVAVANTGTGVTFLDEGTEEAARPSKLPLPTDYALRTNLDESGMHLAVVKSLVNVCQGQVWSETAPEAGTTLHVTIPVDE
jgi:signal transduction histidine kinase